MIKIISAKYLGDYAIDLTFSDGTHGNYDFAPLVSKEAPMVIPIRDYDRFRKFYLELGALCWKHGLELSAGRSTKSLRSSASWRQLPVPQLEQIIYGVCPECHLTMQLET